MTLFMKIAWRNLFRNTRRTIITCTTMSLGLAALIFTDAFMIGFADNAIENATGSFLGDAQIHSKEYKADMEAHQTIKDADSLINKLQNSPQVKDFAGRVIAQGMLSSATQSQGLSIWGVDPENEKNISMLDDRLGTDSKYLPTKNSLLIGQALADDLGIKLGDRLLLTLADAETGEPAQVLLKVDGIYSFGTKDMDMSIAAVHIDLARDLMGLPSGSFHELAFTVHDKKLTLDLENALWTQLSTEESICESWLELMSEMKMLISQRDMSMWIMGTILFSIVALSIINTLFMAIYERFFEFGVLKSIGTKSSQIFSMVTFEAASLAILGALAGGIIGFGLTYWVSQMGINYNGIEYSGITFYNKIYPTIEVRQFVIYPIISFVFTVLISMYPAGYAARLKPADAMHRSI